MNFTYEILTKITTTTTTTTTTGTNIWCTISLDDYSKDLFTIRYTHDNKYII